MQKAVNTTWYVHNTYVESGDKEFRKRNGG